MRQNTGTSTGPTAERIIDLKTDDNYNVWNFLKAALSSKNNDMTATKFVNEEISVLFTNLPNSQITAQNANLVYANCSTPNEKQTLFEQIEFSLLNEVYKKIISEDKKKNEKRASNVEHILNAYNEKLTEFVKAAPEFKTHLLNGKLLQQLQSLKKAQDKATEMDQNHEKFIESYEKLTQKFTEKLIEIENAISTIKAEIRAIPDSPSKAEQVKIKEEMVIALNKKKELIEKGRGPLKNNDEYKKIPKNPAHPDLKDLRKKIEEARKYYDIYINREIGEMAFTRNTINKIKLIDESFIDTIETLKSLSNSESEKETTLAALTTFSLKLNELNTAITKLHTLSDKLVTQDATVAYKKEYRDAVLDVALKNQMLIRSFNTGEGQLVASAFKNKMSSNNELNQIWAAAQDIDHELHMLMSTEKQLKGLDDILKSELKDSYEQQNSSLLKKFKRKKNPITLKPDGLSEEKLQQRLPVVSLVWDASTRKWIKEPVLVNGKALVPTRAELFMAMSKVNLPIPPHSKSPYVEKNGEWVVRFKDNAQKREFDNELIRMQNARTPTKDDGKSHSTGEPSFVANADGSAQPPSLPPSISPIPSS